MFTLMQFLWYLKFWESPLFKIEWALGMRKFKEYWHVCKQHNDCQVRFFDEHYPSLHMQIQNTYGNMYSSNMTVQDKGWRGT